MGKVGLMNFGETGFAMPVNNPAYQKPPYYMRGYSNMSISYETEYDAVAHMLPAPLEFADENPIVNIGVRRIPFATFGNAMEASISYNVLYKGEPWKFYPYYFCGTDGTENETAMLMGREYYGNAKKIAKIEMSYENHIMVGKVSRPSNVPLFTMMVTPQYPIMDIPRQSVARNINLRYIPGIEEGAGPDICQLIGQECISSPVIGSDGVPDVWSGIGSITFENNSAEDPWNLHVVKRIISASYGTWNNYVPYGFVMHDYLKENK